MAHFKPGSRLPAIVRFSNASGVPQPDALPDMRGAALRLVLPEGKPHDLLNIKPQDTEPALPVDTSNPNSLRLELAARLKRGPVTYAFSIQRYISESITPVEDGAVEWTEAATASLDIGTLVIPSQNILVANSDLSEIDQLAFNPWNAPDELRPLGNLNRARKYVYAASAAAWQAR